MWETAGSASSKAPAVCPGLPHTTWKSLLAPRNPGVSLPGFLGAGSAAPGAPFVWLWPDWVQAHARSLQGALGPGWGLKGDRGLPISLLSAAVPLPAPALRVWLCLSPQRLARSFRPLLCEAWRWGRRRALMRQDVCWAGSGCA